jgi:WD40 repeat protein
MAFRPAPNDELTIGDHTYRIAEHPAAPGMAYGQSGRRGTVYQLIDEAGQAWALKVFLPQFREPRLVGQAERIRKYIQLPGLGVAKRDVLTSSQYITLIREHMELAYAVLMPWIQGRTWLEVAASGVPLSPEDSLAIAHSFIHRLLAMEERGLAHCDLSGPNVILTPDGRIEFVDLEEMYAPDLNQPVALPGGSPGYAHKTAPEGLWQPEADRFAGAVLLAEILGWSDEQICRRAWGEGYFDPREMQTDCERFNLLRNVLREDWSERAAAFFENAWFSETLSLCPTFTEWLAALPETVPERLVEEEPSSEGQEETIAGFGGEYEEPFMMRETTLEEIDTPEWVEVQTEEPETSIKEMSFEWTCPKCGEKVGGEVEVCPYCEVGRREGETVSGTTIQQSKSKVVPALKEGDRFRWTIIIGVALFLGLIIVVGWAVSGNPVENTQTPTIAAVLLSEEMEQETQVTTAQSIHTTPTKESTTTPTSPPTATSTLTPTVDPGPLKMTKDNIKDIIQFRTLQGHLERVTSLSWSPDGSQLSSGATDNSIRIWDVKQGIQHSALEGLERDIVDVAWSPLGDRIAIVNERLDLSMWDTSNGELSEESQNLGPIYRIAWSSDGSKLGALTESPRNVWDPYGGNILIWDDHAERDAKLINVGMEMIVCLNWSPDGSQIALGGIQLESRPVTDTWAGKEYEHTALFGSGEVRVIDAEDGEAIVLFQVHFGLIKDDYLTQEYERMAVAWSPDGQHFASAGPFDTLYVWETSDWTKVYELPGSPAQSPGSFSWSPDSSLIAVALSGKRVQIVDPISGEVVTMIEVDEFEISKVAWSPNAAWLAVGSEEGTIHIFGVQED